MRFSVEQINNSTKLLPNVSLGYQIFDQCSDTHSFPGVLNLISEKNEIQPWSEPHMNVSEVIAVIGAYTSTETRTVAPLFMVNLIPMVLSIWLQIYLNFFYLMQLKTLQCWSFLHYVIQQVSYGAASSIFSSKQNFPSFLRTVHPNKDVIEVVINILLNFNWSWVAFLYSDNDYGQDGLALFMDKIKDTEMCLAYNKGLDYYTNYTQIFEQINEQRINVIIVFAPEWNAEALITSAIQQNVTNKVWIAGDAWSLNKQLPKENGIRNVGTILGVAEPAKLIPGFSDFIYSSENQNQCEDFVQQKLCNQRCNCEGLTPEDVINADPSFNFPVYSAVYATSYALHHVLQCESGRCNDNITVYPYMILAELRKSNFTLLNETIHFDENGDPLFGSYNIVFWNQSGSYFRMFPRL
ncbi:taste receptor type 1 member 2-like [Betta splendens]|uniref:Taste receptor type 1 member 2-like n=1 Tax=Betta splendens TaxID=158456 RepID=A0A9W2XX61_BETSP|nr:taste receptor type 1 member 2-like [Betta splendens]